MREALREAQAALAAGEIPIGAVIVSRGRVIGRGHNMTERLTDTTAHAEMLAITAATEAIGGKYLTDCTLYVTVEPCPMCAGALNWAQVGRIPPTYQKKTVTITWNAVIPPSVTSCRATLPAEPPKNAATRAMA